MINTFACMMFIYSLLYPFIPSFSSCLTLPGGLRSFFSLLPVRHLLDRFGSCVYFSQMNITFTQPGHFIKVLSWREKKKELRTLFRLCGTNPNFHRENSFSAVKTRSLEAGAATSVHQQADGVQSEALTAEPLTVKTFRKIS